MPVKTRSQTKCLREGYSAGQRVSEGSGVTEGMVPRNAKGYPSVGQLTLKQINK
jgi:hypothetical protein